MTRKDYFCFTVEWILKHFCENQTMVHPLLHYMQRNGYVSVYVFHSVLV